MRISFFIICTQDKNNTIAAMLYTANTSLPRSHHCVACRKSFQMSSKTMIARFPACNGAIKNLKKI
jgi:hypothetical protein